MDPNTPNTFCPGYSTINQIFAEYDKNVAVSTADYKIHSKEMISNYVNNMQSYTLANSGDCKQN